MWSHHIIVLVNCRVTSCCITSYRATYSYNMSCSITDSYAISCCTIGCHATCRCSISCSTTDRCATSCCTTGCRVRCSCSSRPDFGALVIIGYNILASGHLVSLSVCGIPLPMCLRILQADLGLTRASKTPQNEPPLHRLPRRLRQR
jgi:hypothetical protein